MTTDRQPDLFDLDDQAPSRPGTALSITIPTDLRPYLRIGTCSWKYDSWKGLLYDTVKTYRADDYLADYAQHLDTVEIDQWFWSLFPTGVTLPSTDTVRRYADSVPGHFRFTVKASSVSEAVPCLSRADFTDPESMVESERLALVLFQATFVDKPPQVFWLPEGGSDSEWYVRLFPEHFQLNV